VAGAVAGPNEPRSFSCFLVGEGSLLVPCAKLLLDAGHRVLGLVSPTPELRRWAGEAGVPAVDFGPGRMDFLSATPCDYLFSISNLRILPPEVLALPHELPINFHDALLPRGAGVFATTWAILEGEKRHGVTWHVMTAEADAGPILKQREVTVDASETAYTLDLKCYEAGIASFAELIAELAEGRATPVAQDPSRRTYRGRLDRPPGAGVVSWRRSAEELDAAVRACDFGPQPNGFGTVKVAVGGELVVVREAEVGEAASTAPAGTVVDLSDEGVTVATASRDLRLRRLATLAGAPLAPAEVAARWGVGRGGRLPELDPERADRLAAAHRATCRHEAFWVERLAGAEALEPPAREPAAGVPAASTRTRREVIPVPAELRSALAGGELPGSSSERLLAALLAFLVRLGGGGEGRDVELRWRLRPAAWDGLGELFAPRVPFRAPDLGSGRGLGELCAEVVGRLREVGRRRTFQRDLWARYPRLGARRALAAGFPIAVERVEELGGPAAGGVPELPPGSALLVQIPRRGGVACRLVAEVAEATAARRLGARLAAFLRAAAGPAGRDVTRIPLLSEAERQLLLVEWNDTATAGAHDRCVHQLFAERARRRPDAPAVTFEERTVSYGELDRRSTRLATFLARRGIGPGSLVGVYLERSAELVVGLLAVLKTGAAYLPLDPIYPPGRIALLLADTRVPLLLTQASLEPHPRDHGGAVVVLDRSWPAIEAGGGDPPAGFPAPGELAYVIYTSGSTGRPKGVRVRHRGLTNFLDSMARAPGFGAGDKLLAVTTICFDIAGLELFLPLVTGGVVEVVAAPVAADGFGLSRRLERSRPTVMQATPATWKMLIAAGWGGDRRLRVLCGGEALPPDLAAGLRARAREVWNLYGPTETTIWSSLDAVGGEPRITVGRPIANTRFYLLDERRQPVPPGVPGELWIGGHGVAAGYLDRPELTAERFVAAPFGDGGVLYRTGDLARYANDGRVLYLSRVDNQVKLHGYRIELGEIEHTLCRHPAVAEAVVVVDEEVLDNGLPGTRRLAAYLVPAEPEAPPPVAELRRELRAVLPDYMVPAAWVTLERLPLTPNGKVDRKALPPAAAGDGAEPQAPPGTELERTLAEIWCRTLRRERVGIDDKFLEIGGDSLQLVEVVREVNERFGESLTGVDMFRHPTIRGLARRLGQAGREEPGDRAAVRPPRRDRATLDELRERRLDLRRRRSPGR